LNQITDLKSASKEGTQKNFARGESQRNFFQGGKVKLAYFAGGKNLFILLKMI
jgi:hypothetical protein